MSRIIMEPWYANTIRSVYANQLFFIAEFTRPEKQARAFMMPSPPVPDPVTRKIVETSVASMGEFLVFTTARRGFYGGQQRRTTHWVEMDDVVEWVNSLGGFK